MCVISCASSRCSTRSATLRGGRRSDDAGVERDRACRRDEGRVDRDFVDVRAGGAELRHGGGGLGRCCDGEEWPPARARDERGPAERADELAGAASKGLCAADVDDDAAGVRLVQCTERFEHNGEAQLAGRKGGLVRCADAASRHQLDPGRR
jgi:hypothetical protein